MATPLQPSSLFGRALFQQAPCNILSYWGATAGCVLRRAHTPSCRVSPPSRSSPNFPSRFLAPKASPPSSATTDRLPTPSTSSSPACTQSHFRPRRLSSKLTWSAPRVSQPSPATDLDRTGSNRLTSPDTVCIHVIQALRFHCNRTVHPGHWLGWARPTPPQLLRPHPPVPLHQQRFRRLPPPRTACGRLGLSQGHPAIRGHHRRPEPRRRIALQPFPWPPLSPSPRRRIASQLALGPAFPKPPPPDRLAAFRSAPAFPKPPPPDRLATSPSAPTLLKALPPTRLAAFSLSTLRSRPRRGTALRRSRRPPLCPRPTPRRGIASQRPCRSPLCPRPRPRRGTASRGSRRPPLCPRPRPRRGTASRRSRRPPLRPRHGPRRGITSRRPHRPPLYPRPRPRRGIASRRPRRPPLCPGQKPRHGIAPRRSRRPPLCPRPRPRCDIASRRSVGQRIAQDQDPAVALLHRVSAGPRFVQGLAVNSPCSVSVGHISTFGHIAESPSNCTREREIFRPWSTLVRGEQPRCASVGINGWTGGVVKGCQTNSGGCEAGGVVGLVRVPMKG